MKPCRSSRSTTHGGMVKNPLTHAKQENKQTQTPQTKQCMTATCPNGLCQTQRYWLLCSQGLKYGLCLELLSASGWTLVNRFDKSVGSDGRPAQASNLACDNGTAVILMGWLARVVAACNFIFFCSQAASDL